MRISGNTRRGLAVLFLLLPVVGVGAASAFAETDEMAVDRALRRVLRAGVPLPERLAAARVALDGTEVADGETLLRAGAALLADEPEVGGWLLLRGRARHWPDPAVATEVRARVAALLEDPNLAAGPRAAFAAAGFLMGMRPESAPALLTAVWPPSPLVETVLRHEGVWPADGGGTAPAAPAVRGLLVERLPALRALDQAESADVASMHAGLAALQALGAKALPVLLFEARQAVEAPPQAGRLPRATRAVLALGFLGSREATPVLAKCLDAPNGWVQVAAANALGDLGDPAAAVALCRKITYRGDVLRPRDKWDYPGERETTVAREDWPSVQYFVTDCAAADALLRLGLSGAAGWLIRTKLDPARANFRIRVLQDAVDALARSVPGAPVSAYVVDTGLPHRRRAFEALLTWWEEGAFDIRVEGARFDPEDEGFRREARRMVERLRGRSIMELQISQETCALIGPPVTSVLLETLAVSDSRVLRTEIARALGAVRDPRAVDTLLELIGDRASFLRATAAESLGAYLLRDERVEPALRALLEDREAAPRVAALSALVRARPSQVMLDTLRAKRPEAYRKRFGADDRDYRQAWTVAMLVQEGDQHWPAVSAWLSADERYVRRASWDLLRRAAGLPYTLYDGNRYPTDPGWEAIDETRVIEALRKRRAAR